MKQITAKFVFSYDMTESYNEYINSLDEDDDIPSIEEFVQDDFDGHDFNDGAMDMLEVTVSDPANMPNPQNEFAVLLANGNSIVVESTDKNTNGTEYVRVINADGVELAYWDHKEWQDDPQSVMGAFIASLGMILPDSDE